MKKSERNEILHGANLLNQLGSIEAVVDYCDIIALNDKHTASWTKGNNSGNAEIYNKENAKQDKIWEAAKLIAEKHGWKVSAPGLYWIITDAKGQEVR